MAWTPPAEEEKKPTGTSWTPPENEVKKIWTPPAEDDPENPVNEKEPWRLKKLKESGVTLSEEQEKLLWKYEEDRPLLDKAGEAVRTFFPAAAKVANQLGTGSVDLIYKGVLKPIDAMSQTPEEAEKTFKEAGNAWRSFGSGAMSDMEETIDMATRFSMFGSGITDKLQGLPEEERFKRFKNREVMRQFGQAVREEMPDRAAALISENPFLKKAAGAYAKLSGGTPEEVKMAEEAFTELVKESGLTKEELDENISMLGEFMSPVALPGGNRITGAIAKPVGKVVQKTGELALRGIKPIAGAVEGAAELTLKGTELVQGGARKIGEYTTNDPDTLLRTGANTVVMPINAVAKPTSNVARVVKDVTSQVDVGGAAGRRGLFERAGRAETSSDLTRRLFGPQGKGGVARAKVADWTVRQANAIIQPGVNGAALNVLMGLPDIETAAQLGEVAGTGFGIGGFAGARVFDRAGAIIDPTTSLAEKITTVVTPDMAQRRRDEDADIKRFLATATPEMKSQMADLSNIDKRKTAIDSKLINLRQQKERTINAADEANLQRQIDGFEKQRQALEKATPETVREAERQVQLAFMDAMDLAQATGTSAGLRGLNLTVLNADNAEGFFRNLYGGAVERAEGVVNLLTGRTDLTMQESQNLQQARELLNRFSTEVAGAKNQRGFAIGVDGTDPNADGYVAPHLRKVNQTGATAVINGDLVKHLSEQGFDVRRVINHEMQHALQQFREVKDMLAPIRGDLFDQKVVKDDGTVEVWKQGIFSDADIARYGANYAAKMSPADNGASFIAQFQDVDAFNAYIKDEILAEVASQTGDYSNGTRAALDDVGRNLVDWLEVKTKAGALRKMKEGLRTFGIVFDNYGGYSNVLGADLPPEALAMIRQYQRQLRDFDGSMQIQTTREEDAPDIPMTAILGSRALQEKYKDADFFEKEQILRSTAPDGTVTEIVMPKGAKLDPFVDIYRIQGGQLVDANGNPVQLPPEITFGSLPEGSTFQMDTRIARKPDGSPITLSAREIKSRALERTQSIRNVIDSAPDDGTPNRLIDTGNGNYRGVMSPSQLAAVLSIPNNVLAPALKRQIQFFNELMQRGDGTRAIFEYQAALLNGKYKAIAPKIRDEVPIGWQFTKDGNFALTTISVSRLYDKLQAWADQGTVTQEQTWTGELIPVKRSKNLALWNGDTNKFWNSLVQVLDNHANGREGWVGLHSDELTAKRMRNKVNDLFNVFNKETKEMNPDRSTLPRVRGRDNVDIIVRSRRVDRINSFSESPSTKVPVNYGKLLINYMPETNPLAAPQTPEQFMENINGSVSATRIRNAIATGAVDQLESELRNSDDLLPTESLFVSQGEGGDPLIQVTSMLDPNVEGALEPEEVVVDLDARTAEELARLEAEEAAAMAAQQQAPVEPAPAPEPAPEPAPAPTTQFMPVEAPSGERGFQSKLQLEIQKKFKGASATPEQLKAVLGNPQNVKPEEVKWSGVMDEIDRLAQENNGKVPVQELMNYLRNEGQVKFNEVTLGGVSKLRTQDEIDQLERQAQRTGRWDEYEQAVLEFEDQQLGSNANQTGNLTIHAKYQLPGGKNYREVVLSMPSDLSRSQAKIDAINKRRKEIIDTAKEQDLFNRSQTDPEAKALNDSLTAEFVELGKQADQLNADIRDGKTGEQFTSSHFPDVPNYIAHMRVNERTDADGNPGLFVEEFQSDRHQQGREFGYQEKQDKSNWTASINEIDNRYWNIYDSNNSLIQTIDRNKAATPQDAINQASEITGVVPDAPFRKDWGVQLFKRALRDAVESGKKWIGWTTGIEQVKRYENAIRQTVDRINWNTPVGSQKTFSATKNNNIVIVGQINNDGLVYDSDVEDFNGMQLSEVFGKEIASKIIAEKSGSATGDDLTVGGEGMKGFYDQILPKEIGKYVAKMGGKVEKSGLDIEKVNVVGTDKNLKQVSEEEARRAFEEGKPVFTGRQAELGVYYNRMGEAGGADLQFKINKGPYYLVDEMFGNTPIWRVNITPEMENVVRAGQIQFMPAESDAEYLRLAQDPEANQEKLQAMVDEAARRAGYDIDDPVFHATENGNFSVFNESLLGSTTGAGTADWGFWFGQVKENLEQAYGGKALGPFYLKKGRKVDVSYDTWQMYSDYGQRHDARNFYNNRLKPYDTIEVAIPDEWNEREEVSTLYAVKSPSQIKSADPVTYDDAGNVIPLSQRFQTTSPDIRFMPAKGDFEQIRRDAIDKRNKRRDEAYEILYSVIPETADILKRKINFEDDQQEFNSIPFSMPSVGFDYDRSFHLTKIVRRILDTLDPMADTKAIQNLRRKWDTASPIDKQDIQDRIKKYEDRIKKTASTMKYAFGVFADLTASLPEAKARDLRQDKIVDPWVVLKKHFPDGESKDINKVILELRDIIKFGTEKENFKSSINNVLNAAEVLRDFTDVDQSVIDQLFKDRYNKSEAQIKKDEEEFFKEVTNPEFYDVEKRGTATFSQKIEPQGGIQFMPADSDSEYLRLAQDPKKNQEQLQRMVDEAATSKGIPITYPLFRGVRRKPKDGVMYTQGERATLSFTDVPEIAKLYTHKQEFGGITPSPYGSVKKVYLNIKNPLDIRDEGTKVNLGDFIDKYFNWDWRLEDEIFEDNVFSGDDLVRLLNRMSKLEANTNFESDIQSSDPDGIFRHRNFGEVASSVREILDSSENANDAAEQIENILSSIELDTYAIADNKWAIKHLKDLGYDGLIHKDTIEAGKNFFEEESVAGKPIEEIKGINSDEDYSHNTWRPFNKEQIKLSDPVTYDNEGNVIPLSQRFQTTSTDIRFMPEEGPLADIQAPEQKGEKAALEGIQIPLEIEKPIGKNDPLPIFKSTIVDGTTPLDKFDWSYPTNVQYKSKNGETFTFSYDPKLLVEPPIKDLVDELKGQPVIMLEADRQRATGGDMGGPLHPFLKSNQVSVIGSDGIEYKPVWANMTSTFISGTKGRLASHGAKHAVVHLMDNIAHKSNKRTVRTLDKMMREANLKKFDKEIVALAMQAGIIEGKKSKINAGITALKRKLSGANAKKTALIKKQIDVLLEKRNAITPQGATGEIFKAVSKIKTAQSNVKTGRWKQSTVENAINNLKSMSDRKEYKQILRKLKSLFISDNIGKTFNDRGSAVSAILSFKFGSFEPMVVLRDSSDFKDNENLDIVTVVELSQNPEFFALYFGNDPKQEAAMSPAEKQARDQMRNNPNFVEHEAYDWVMLGPKDGNNFLVRNPMKPEEVFKEYRLAHPKQTVKKGSDETVAGAMRKFAGVKLIVDEMAEPVVANKKSKK